MLFPSRLMYSSSRISRSRLWAISSAPKFRPSWSTLRTSWLPTMRRAMGNSARTWGGVAMMALNARPMRMGMRAASPALPTAPMNITRMRYQ